MRAPLAEPGSASAPDLRGRAEGLAAGLPPLLAEAERLAAAVHPGGHGRRRAGQGAEFWQYRAALEGDEARRIDWRRSARGDQTYLREQEWQQVQAVQIWADRSASMSYRSAEGIETKAARASLLALAVAVLLERGGERFGLADGALAPRTGRAQLARLAEVLAGAGAGGMDAGGTETGAVADYGSPDAAGLLPWSRAVFLSDFFGDPGRLRQAVLTAADRGVGGVLLQVTDPAEEEFPFAGRTIFQSMAGGLRHEAREAAGLAERYRARLAERRTALERLARDAGWTFGVHRTDHAPAPALLWLFAGLEGQG